jgi:hypothetical protein
MANEPLSIPEQAKKIEEDCERAAIRDALVSARWDKWNLYLGLSSTIAAALAAFLAGSGQDALNIIEIQHANVGAALFALTSSVLASTLTFLAPAEKASSYQQTSNKYHSLRERIRFFRNTRCPTATNGLEQELESIIIAKQEIDSDHPILPEWAYSKAHAKIIEKIRRNDEINKLRASQPHSSAEQSTLSQ